MLVGAALMPHPPIIIPDIGQDETKKVKKTIQACQKVGLLLAKKDPETLIIISPHGLVYPDQINICAMTNLKGDLSQFNAPDVSFELKNDPRLLKKILQKAREEEIEILAYNNFQDYYELDHGTIVPLYFILPETGTTKIIPITYSLQRRETHFQFGQALAEVIKKDRSRIAIVASGDLSHRLSPFAPAGFSQDGQIFDQKIIQLLKDNETDKILKLSPKLVKRAGECGYNSILILLGALSQLQAKPQLLSYEGPFGVGYAVIAYHIKNTN